MEGLRAFEAAARLGSFERAAGELSITASAVGKRVVALEALLGQPLFERSAKALVLTVAGREYLQTAGAALALLQAMPQHQSSYLPPQQRVQRLRVSTPPTFARQVLVPALASFANLHPLIELEVLLSIPYLGSSGLQADVEVHHSACAAGSDDEPLLHDCVLPMAAPSLLQRLPVMHTPVDLAHAPLLRTPIEPWAPWFKAVGLGWPEPSQGHKLVDLGLTLEAAVCSQGVVLGRPSLARHWLQAGSLVPLFDTTAQPTQQYRLRVNSTGAAEVFAHWLRSTCAALDLQSQALLSAVAGRNFRPG
jgi:LysR family transcriptional regulator, glycine cleavage system transcriptional activator